MLMENEHLTRRECVMFPTSAAMLKNLSQSEMTSPSFMVENILRTKASGLTLGLNFNWTLMRREKESVGIIHNMDPAMDIERNRLAAQRLQRDPRINDCERILSLQDRDQDNKNGILDLESERVEDQSNVDRLSAMERLSERISNNSNNSIDEDRISTEMDVGVQEEVLRNDRARLSMQMDRRLGRSMHMSDEMRMHMVRETERLDRIGEETCTCGDDQCTGPGCRRVQEKEKPQLKFSVSAILGANHEKRPNPGNNLLLVFYACFDFIKHGFC